MPQTILVVDDDPDDVEITTRILQGCGARVETAPRGDAALERLGHLNTLPAVILLDLKMPGMSGFDTLRTIRADGRMNHIPVIIVGSSDLEADEKEAYEAGADGFLHKSFDIDRFSSDVKSLVTRRLNTSRDPHRKGSL